MGTDLSIRPAGTLAAVAVVAPVTGAAADAVATELPARQSVTAADTVAPAHIAADTSNPALSHQVILDPEAASLVYRVVDDRTDNVVSQYPEDAVLRRRAYFHALDALKAERAFGSETDRRA